MIENPFPRIKSKQETKKAPNLNIPEMNKEQ